MSQAPAKKFFDAPELSFSNGGLNAKAAASYGFSCCPIWDGNNLAHRNETRYWDSWEGVWRYKSVNWIIKKVRTWHTCAPFSILELLKHSSSAQPRIQNRLLTVIDRAMI
jgi:hypothetical protein